MDAGEEEDGHLGWGGAPPWRYVRYSRMISAPHNSRSSLASEVVYHNAHVRHCRDQRGVAGFTSSQTARVTTVDG
jgi:hypothetical protein